MFALVATDLDGTLLNPDHSVAAETKATLQALAARGVRFVIATGRHYCDVREIRNVLGIEAFLITSNGARIHAPDNRPLHAENLDPELVNALVQEEFTKNISTSLYLSEDWLIGEPNESLLEYHQDSGFHYTVTDLPSYPGDDVGKILYVGEHPQLLELEARILERFDDEVYVTFSASNCLEVMAPTVSKGHALTVVLSELGLDHDDCVAFGDNLNDIQMLQTAGRGYAMGNANPALLAALPGIEVIGRNDEAGVARQLAALYQL
ncbi:Cof-type HAD-IIB family hydrolase [Chitinibacteraceae bacterium HSL-7]